MMKSIFWLVACLCLHWYSPVHGQELLVSAKIIDETANPDTVEITFNITLPINQTNANLTSDLTPWLEIQQMTTIGSVVTRDDNIITINFNSTISNDQTIATFNITFRDVDVSGSVNLSSTLTFFTVLNGRTYTNTSNATVCFLKETRLVTTEESRQWYIAIALLLSLVVGIIIAIVVFWLIENQCGSGTQSTGAAGGKDRKSDREAAMSNSSFSNYNIDLAQVIAAGDDTQTRLLELCEVNDLAMTEDRLQWEKAALLEVILNSVVNDKEKASRERDSDLRSLRKEIQKETENASGEIQINVSRERELNQKRMTALRRKHELEIEKIKTQTSTSSSEAQEEMLKLVQERHLLEVKELEHVSTLRLIEAERRGQTPTDVKCTILCDKLDSHFNEEDQSHSSATRDAYGFVIANVQKRMETESTRSRTVTMNRRNEVNKISTNESEVRGKWNKYAQAMVESVKTVCRELDLDAEVRKTIIAFIKERMLEAKTFFDQQMAKERTEFLRLCAIEKAKYSKAVGTEFTTREIKENPINWSENQQARVDAEMEKLADNQREYEKFVVSLWNKKFDDVLKQTGEKMTILKNSVVQQLAQNGASRHSVEEFISTETKNEAIGDQSIRDSVFQEDIQDDDDKRIARELILQCHNEVLKIFFESQPFNTDKTTSQKLALDLKQVKQKSAKKSLKRIRVLIQNHVEAIERKNKPPKAKSKKGYPKLSEESLRSRLKTQLEVWKENDAISSGTHRETDASLMQFQGDILALKENLTTLFSNELQNQMTKKSKLTLLLLDLNALERLMITLLQSLVMSRKLSPAECTVVIQQHKNQTAELEKSSLLRTRRRLEQSVRKRLHSPNPLQFSNDNDTLDVTNSEVMHHLKSTEDIGQKAVGKIKEDSNAAKDKFELLTQLNEQQAMELRELDLKVIQALTKVANVSSSEMNACLTLLLHHRDQTVIQSMLQTIYSGLKDVGDQKSGLLLSIRDMISQQRHRLAENLLRTDEDFTPTPLRSPNKLQRIKQPHHVTFLDDSSPTRRDRLSPLPDIRPEPVGRTSTPDLESLTDYQIHPSTVYSNFNQPSKPTKRRKKKSLKNLSVARWESPR